jgi:membrane-bound inhibitor of C-type lysozyme
MLGKPIQTARSKPLAAALAAIIALTALPVAAQILRETQENAAELIQTRYLCERGAIVEASYITAASGESFAVLHVEGRQIPMTSAPAASGARYLATEMTGETTGEGFAAGHEWWIKGDHARFSWIDPEPSEQVTLLTDCTAQ